MNKDLKISVRTLIQEQHCGNKKQYDIEERENIKKKTKIMMMMMTIIIKKREKRRR